MTVRTSRREALSILLGRYAAVRRRYRFAALVCLPVVVCGLFYTLLLSEQQAVQAELQVRVDEATRQRSEKLAYLANARAWTQKLAGLETQLREAHLALPDDPEVPQFLAQLGTMAHDVGLSIERFAPRPEAPREFYAESSFVVQVRGSYHQIAMLLAQINAMERIVTVGNLSLEQKLDDTNKADAPYGARAAVNGAFEVKIYRLLRDDEMVKADKDGKQEEAH